jgi:carboxymethylenebutenolidase
VAFAPDLFNGRTAQTIAQAERLSGEADSQSDANFAKIASAVDYLWERAQPRDRGLGVVGFSFGAYYALQLSGRDPERVGVVTLFYGCGEGDFDQAQASYLGHFAENDPYEPAENIDWLENELQVSGRPVTFYRYAGVGHWFFEPDRIDACNEPAANLAWERTVTFLRENLQATMNDQ